MHGNNLFLHRFSFQRPFWSFYPLSFFAQRQNVGCLDLFGSHHRKVKISAMTSISSPFCIFGICFFASFQSLTAKLWELSGVISCQPATMKGRKRAIWLSHTWPHAKPNPEMDKEVKHTTCNEFNCGCKYGWAKPIVAAVANVTPTHSFTADSSWTVCTRDTMVTTATAANFNRISMHK